MGELPMWPIPTLYLMWTVLEQADKAVINLLDEEEEEEGAAGDENEDREAVTIPSPVPANESDPASSAGEAMNPFASFTYSADDPGNGKLSGTDTTKPVLPSGTHARMHSYPYSLENEAFWGPQVRRSVASSAWPCPHRPRSRRQEKGGPRDRG